jgi:CHAD domain-containing protein
VVQLFEPHLNTAAAGHFKKELRHFGEIFGTARDWDVFCLETLSAAMVDLPTDGLEDLNIVAEVERQFAHAAVADAVRGHDFTAMVLGLAIWARTRAGRPSELGDDERLDTLAPSLLDRVAHRTKQRSRHAGRLSAAKRHRLRKALKKLWFDVESFAGLYRSSAVKIYRDRCLKLEEILGLANDAVVTERLALLLVSASRPELATSAGSLMRWSKRRARKALTGFKPALHEFRAARRFWSQ